MNSSTEYNAPRVNRTFRLALIAATVARLAAPKVAAAYLPTVHDRREEITLATAHQDRGTLAIDDDLPTLKSRLAFSQAMRDEGTEMSASDRRKLRAEGIHYRGFITKPALDADES